MNETNSPRRIAQSIGALVAGFFVGAVLSLGTDEILHVANVYPQWGQSMSDALFLLATTYRIIYNIAGCYVIARLAPDRPIQHALVGGAVGFALSVAGAAVTWNRELGPHCFRGCGNRDAVRMGGRRTSPHAVACTVGALRSSCF